MMPLAKRNDDNYIARPLVVRIFIYLFACPLFVSGYLHGTFLYLPSFC